MANKVDSLVQKSFLAEVFKSKLVPVLKICCCSNEVSVWSQPLLGKHFMVLKLLNMGSALSCCTQTAVMLTVYRWGHLAQLLQGTASSDTGRNSTLGSWNTPSKSLGRNFQGKNCIVQLRELHRWGRTTLLSSPQPWVIIWRSQNHRLVGVGDHPVQCPFWDRVTWSRWHKNMSRWVGNVSRKGNSTTSLGSCSSALPPPA